MLQADLVDEFEVHNTRAKMEASVSLRVMGSASVATSPHDGYDDDADARLARNSLMSAAEAGWTTILSSLTTLNASEVRAHLPSSDPCAFILFALESMQHIFFNAIRACHTLLLHST